jgi:hypothetical protein
MYRDRNRTCRLQMMQGGLRYRQEHGLGSWKCKDRIGTFDHNLVQNSRMFHVYPNTKVNLVVRDEKVENGESSRDMYNHAQT